MGAVASRKVTEPELPGEGATMAVSMTSEPPVVAIGVAERVVVVLVCSLDFVTGNTRPESKAIRKGIGYLIVQDTNVTKLAQLADAVLAGATFAEKACCYVNADGRIQYSEAALPPRDGSLPDLDIFAILSGRGVGPVSSREVLKEVARVVPSFAAAEAGVVPEFGVVVGEALTVSADSLPFADAWTLPRGARV